MTAAETSPAFSPRADARPARGAARPAKETAATDLTLDPHPLWRTFLVRLQSLDRAHNRDAGRPIDPEVCELLADAEARRAYEPLYAAEQRLIALLPEGHVDIEATRRFDIARRKGLPVEPVLHALYEKAKSADERRAILVQLVDELQYFYVKRALTKQAQRDANDRLNRLAWLLVMPTFIILALLYIVPDLSRAIFGAFARTATVSAERGDLLAYVSRYHLFAVMWFGLIGAYFSRLISFQQKSALMDRETLLLEYSNKSLAIRLIIGLLASIIMYLIMKAEVVGGSLFPSWEAFSFVQDGAGRSGSGPAISIGPTFTEGDVPPPPPAEPMGPPMAEGPGTSVSAATPSAPPSKAGIPLISRDFAQLLVWSLLAGFSERLIPDRFSALEKRAFADGVSR